MSSAISNIIRAINDGSRARIKLIIKGGTQQNLECTFKEDAGSNFFLVFQPDVIPANIDLSASHPVSISQESSAISLQTTVVNKKGDRTLHLSATGTLDPASLREYFRVNTATEITVSYNSGQQDGQSVGWTISGDTQDISGSGVLALFPDEPRNRNDLVIEIFLPNKQITVTAVGHVVRKKRLRSKKWQVSFHYNNISTKHRDAIITYLLSVQRKQLRENVRSREY